MDEGRLPHNTLSADQVNSVCIHYPFHPLHGQQLPVFTMSRTPDGVVTVEDGKRKRLRIPLWMVAADAATCRLAEQPTLDAQALLQLTEFFELNNGKLQGVEIHFLTEPSHEATLAVHAVADRRAKPDSQA